MRVRTSLNSEVGEPISKLWIEKIPLFAMSVLSAGITFKAQLAGGALGTVVALPLGVRNQERDLRLRYLPVEVCLAVQIGCFLPTPLRMDWYYGASFFRQR